MSNEALQRLFDIDLWLVGAAHFLILVASFQVPYRLSWKQDLRKLMPFNRKLLWVQGGFTVLTIMAFGTLTLVLHRDLLDYADRCRRDLLFPRRLAQGNTVRRGTCSANPAVFVPCRKLCWAIHLALVAECESLKARLWLRRCRSSYLR